MQNIIELNHLSKTFGKKTVVNSVSLAIPRHSLFAFLGQNGAGITTTINMILGILAPDSGNILYDGGIDYMAFKNNIGVVFQNNISDELLTVEENLKTMGTLYIKSAQALKIRMVEVMNLLSLNECAKQRFKTLSGGQKRKVEIARALFMSPDILFLDEPTTGLDPKTRADIWAIIHRMKSENGTTVFLTTHYMEETESSDYVAIINEGKITATGSPAELKARYSFDRLIITPNDSHKLEIQLNEMAVKWDKIADTYVIKINTTEESIGLLYHLKEIIRFYEVISGSMDDVFLATVRRKPIQSEGDVQ